MPNSELPLPTPWPKHGSYSHAFIFTVLFHLQLINILIYVLSITLDIQFFVWYSFFFNHCYVFKTEGMYQRKKIQEDSRWKSLTLKLQTWIMTFFGNISRWTLIPKLMVTFSSELQEMNQTPSRHLKYKGYSGFGRTSRAEAAPGALCCVAERGSQQQRL